MRYRLVIFDMDGTTLDTLEDLTGSLNYALSNYDLPMRTLEEVRCFVGNGIRKLVERAVPEETADTVIDGVYHVFLEHYELHCSDVTRPYEGILLLLQTLKANGCLIATVSNKADSAVAILCRKYFDGLFHISIGEKVGVRKKPAPDSVNQVLQKLCIDRDQAVYIGDSEVDIVTARNAGMDCISVDWGFRDRKMLVQAGAEKIVSTPKELLRVIFGQ